MSSCVEVFSGYFSRQFWGNKTGSSGPNSDPSLTPILRKNLQHLIDSLGVKTLLDAGCGDATLFKAMLEEAEFKSRPLTYLGYECVPALTVLNQTYFQGLNLPSTGFAPTFDTVDITSSPLPKVDLILCRDVVHYLPNALIEAFLNRCIASGSRYLLITHNIYSELSANSETILGVFRPVNLIQQPFHWGPPCLTLSEDVYGKELALFDLHGRGMSHE